MKSVLMCFCIFKSGVSKVSEAFHLMDRMILPLFVLDPFKQLPNGINCLKTLFFCCGWFLKRIDVISAHRHALNVIAEI
jgi:hypothetical protein